MMNSILAALLAWLIPASVFAQTYTVSGVVRDGVSQEILVGAKLTLEQTAFGAVSDGDGKFLIRAVPSGDYTLRLTLTGYENLQTRLSLSSDTSLTLALQPAAAPEGDVEEIVVTGTRTAKSIADVPIRVEVIPQEEVEEKILMKPSSVALLLSESTGLRMQTTSGASNTSNLRIQGLQGRYTQILVDGIPNFGGLSSGFGLTQLPPLNLRQIEIVKGAGSVLYGADAISGVVNFITQSPKASPELSAILNTTTQQGLDAAAFYAQQFKTLGFTALGSYNTQPVVDVDGDGFSDVSEYQRLTLSPKFFVAFSGGLRGSLSLGVLSEERRGGAVPIARAALGTGAPYLEQNKSLRLNAGAALTWEVAERQSLGIKAAAMRLSRDAFYGATPFNADQTQLYADVQYTLDASAHLVLFGGAFNSDGLSDRTPAVLSRSYTLNTLGFFAQDEVKFSEQWKAVVSGRIDIQNVFGVFLTPRLSVMYRPSSSITVRLGGGTGYKLPTVFVEEAEEIGFRGASQTPKDFSAERSQSASVDMNYKLLLGEAAATFNASLYLTRIDNALLINDDSLAARIVSLENADGQTLTRGGEVSAQLQVQAFKLSLGYTAVFAEQTNRNRQYELALNPRHAIGIILMWESEELGIKAGLENYFTSSQRLEQNGRNPLRTETPPYWITGALFEKGFGKVRLFVNFENVFDTRQTRFERIVSGNPQTETVQPFSIYAPLEGRVLNGGIRIVL